MPDTLVVNASPLIFLGNADRLELLRMLGASQILVTDVVLDEVTKAGHADKASSVVAKTDWLVRTASPPLPASVIEWDLGPGESSVIATTLQHANACSVIDDLNGRKCARALGVRVMGTIGIVIMAHRLGMIEDPRPVLFELRTAGMWLSDGLIARALELAGL